MVDLDLTQILIHDYANNLQQPTTKTRLSMVQIPLFPPHHLAKEANLFFLFQTEDLKQRQPKPFEVSKKIPKLPISSKAVPIYLFSINTIKASRTNHLQTAVPTESRKLYGAHFLAIIVLAFFAFWMDVIFKKNLKRHARKLNTVIDYRISKVVFCFYYITITLWNALYFLVHI